MTRRRGLSRASRRSDSGVSTMLLVLLLSFFVLPIFGLWAFEIGRANLCRQQLQNAVDSASLAAVATLAMNDDEDPSTAHRNAIQAALKIFRRNFTLGAPLANAVETSVAEDNPAVNNSSLYFEFLNPITRAVEPLDSPNGKLVRVTANLGVEPALGANLGLPRYVIRTVSHGAVPELDVVICFDVSGSIDDQSKVSLIKRKWDGVLRRIVYSFPVSSGRLSQGSIYDIARPATTGTSWNAVPPMLVSSATGFLFSESHARSQGTRGLRSGGVFPEGGQPPGNYAAGAPAYDDVPQLFTDIIVNPNGGNNFASWISSDGFQFPDIATAVEASRGNLENITVFNSSMANTSVSVAPRAGYKAAYEKRAKEMSQPINDAREATKVFVNILNTNTHAHFGFIAFDHQINGTENKRVIDDNVPYGNTQAFPVPQVTIDPSPPVTKYSEVLAAVDNTQAKGSTNIGSAINSAVDMLRTRARPNAVRAIILFTDGRPTAGGPLSGDPDTNARLAAVRARDAAIPVYTIGLAQNAAIIPLQQAILNDTNSSPTTGGIAGISGQQATFNLVTDSSQLRYTFEKIARRLVQLVQETRP